LISPNFRRLVTRYEHHADNFLGFLKLGRIAMASGESES
jgi:hypothetical protein